MATFGTTGYTFNYDLGTADSVVLGKYTLTEAGTLTALRIAYYNSSTSSSGSFKLVIYDDDGTAGAPGTRLFLGSPIYCDADTYDLALDSTLNLPLLPGSYWLGAVLRDTYCVATAAATTGGTHGIYTASGAYTNPPSTLPTLTSSGTYTVEVLATYTPDLKRVVSAGLVAEYVGAWAKGDGIGGNMAQVSWDTGQNTWCQMTPFTLTSPSRVSQVSARLSLSSGSACGIVPVIYDDDGGSGTPGTRLTYGPEVSIPNPTDTRVYLPVSHITLMPGTYWAATWGASDAGSLNLGVSPGSASKQFTYATGYPVPPASASGLSADTGNVFSIAAHYTTDAPGNNSDPTSTWQDLARSHHGALTGFSYTGTDGWKGAGTVSNPFALVSDRTGGRVSCTGAADLRSSTFSVEVWMNLTALDAANNQVVVDNCADDVANGGWWVYFAVNYAYPTLGYRNGLGGYGYLSVQSGVDFRSGVHQAVWTCNGSNLISYKDGNYGTTDTAQGYTPRSANVNLSLMALTSTVYPFNGTLVGLRVYDRVLTADEVTQNYAAGPCAASLQDLSSLIAIGRF